MKNIIKRGLSVVMVLVLCLSVLPGISVTADAASYVYNWGVRGDVASELSDAAENFYAENDTSYEMLSSLSGSADLSTVAASSLYLELQELMKSNHSYITTYGATRQMYAYTDCQNGGGAISSFYSGKSIGPAWDGGSTWNREHTWPNSKGLGGSDENDIMMLRPTHTSENGGRSNTAYGESDGYYDPNSESKGALNLHGDVARIFLYVYVRWGNVNGNGDYDTWGSRGVIESKEVLLKWMAEDPVDTWELGRNDSVESITGTRNVFVDYPELGFLLFNEEVPVDMVTPSGNASGTSSYTVTATSSNNAWGTVSVSGKVITATPAAGYEISGYEVTSGSATVTQSGRTFVVKASSDCTVQIKFAAKAATGISFIENGTVSASYTVTAGDSVTMPTHSTAVPEGYSFVGWSNGAIADTTSKPTAIFAAGESFTVSGNTRMYAVYSYSESGSGATSYKLVTDASQLYEGASVVIAAKGYDFALSTNQKTNNRGDAAITKNSDGTITLTDGVAELTLGAGTVDGTYSFYCSANKGYLYCASTSKDSRLKTQTSVNEAASFAITVNADGSCTLTSQKTGTTRVLLQYNNGSNLFACYMSTSGQQPVSLYVKSAGGTVTHYTTTIGDGCQHADSTFVDGLEATCTTNGWTDGLYCNICQTYVYGHDEIAATGHATAVWMNEVPSSCTTYGIKGHWHCAICDSDYLEKSPTAHTQSAMDLRLPTNPNVHDSDTEVRYAKEATCEATGYTGDTYCLGCQTKLATGTDIPKQAHTIGFVAASEPTHADDGCVDHYACSVCGKFFTDETGTTELAADKVLIPALGHNFGDWKHDANKHWKECDCTAKGEEGVHAYGTWTTTKNPGVGIDGSKERTCTVCSYKQVEKIPATTSPVTGDAAQIGLWIVLMIVSACGLVTVLVLVNRKRKKN